MPTTAITATTPAATTRQPGLGEQVRIAVNSETLESTLATYPDDIAEPLEWLYAHYLDRGLTLAALGKHVDIDGSNISRAWRGCYQGNLANLASQVRSYRERFQQAYGVGQPDFVRTQLAEFLWKGCDLARYTPSIEVIIGDYGQGKTVAAKELAALHRDSVVYYESCKVSAYGRWLRHFARALGITAGATTAQEETIVSRFRRRRVKLLIIDEFHAPFTHLRRGSRHGGPIQIAEFLRDLYDRAEGALGIALIGTSVLPDHLRHSTWSAALAQLLDRGDSTIDLCNWTPPLDDLRRFYQQYKLPPTPTREAAQIIKDILTAHSLRKLVFRLRATVRAANARHEPPNWSHFVEVAHLKAALADPHSDIIHRLP